jgi:hypothetical protein
MRIAYLFDQQHQRGVVKSGVRIFTWFYLSSININITFFGKGSKWDLWLGWAQMTKKVPHTQPRPSQPPLKSLLATEKNGLLNRLPAKVSFSIFD